MTTAPSLVVAGAPDIARKLQSTDRFPAVFHAASATELRALSQSGKVRSPAAFMFSSEFKEDLPDAGVAVLANGLVAAGFTVVVHSLFTERGDVFDSRVVTKGGPMTLSNLLEVLGAAPTAETTTVHTTTVQPDMFTEPPPEAWLAEGAMSAGPDEAHAGEPHAGEPQETQQGNVELAEPRNPEPHGAAPAAPEFQAQESQAHESQGFFAWDEEPAPQPQAAGDAGHPEDMPPGAPARPGHYIDPLTAGLYDPADHYQGDEPSYRGRKPMLLVVAAVVLAVAGIGVFGALGGEPDADRARSQSQRSPAPGSASPSAKSTAPRTSAPSPGSGSPTPRSAPPAPSSSPTTVREAGRYAPTQVRIQDGRVSIKISWTDATRGRAAHYVVGGPAGRPPTTLASAPPGAGSVQVTALNPSVDYCLTVVAVVDVDRVAHAEPVCTHRVKRSG